MKRRVLWFILKVKQGKVRKSVAAETIQSHHVPRRVSFFQRNDAAVTSDLRIFFATIFISMICDKFCNFRLLSSSTS